MKWMRSHIFVSNAHTYLVICAWLCRVLRWNLMECTASLRGEGDKRGGREGRKKLDSKQ